MTHRPWLKNVFQPLVVSGMIGCIAVALAELAYLINSNWNGTFLVVVCVLAALEACYSHQLLKRMALVDRNMVKFRLTELALFLVLIKIGSFVGDSLNNILAEIQTWPTNPANIFNDEVLVAFGLAFASWMATTETMGDLERLDDPPEYYRDEVIPGQSITIRFFVGGVLLLIITGLSRLTIGAMLDLSRPSVPGLVLNVLIYFLLGLVLLGQVQYTTMHRRWHAREVKVTQKLAARWVRYSLIFIGLAALVAFLIPTSYTMGFLETAGNVFAILAAILQFIFNLIVFLLSLPLWLLLFLFKRDAAPPSLPELSAEAEEPQVSPSMEAPPWFEILRSLVFWLVAIGAVFYVVRSYLRDHPQIREALSSLWLFRAIGDLLAALWRRLTGLASVISERIPRGLSLRRRKGEPTQEKASRFLRLGTLSPRERTLYYYLSILRRAGQRGFRRKDSQTPYEYDASLEPHLPQAQQEMGLLTDDFVEARYSPHPIDREKEKEARARWKEVRAAVRALKQKQADKD
ncbi:MAG: DUF4129 domain-containing protein [Anaerolineae bacterium]|nr:DUF4129 domain-containing protein [Anaerolineae bacterium]